MGTGIDLDVWARDLGVSTDAEADAALAAWEGWVSDVWVSVLNLRSAARGMLHDPAPVESLTAAIQGLTDTHRQFRAVRQAFARHERGVR
jgi:hypothetical protein